MGFLGKGLKKHLPSSLWTELEATYVGPDIPDNWKALERILDLFCRVSKEVGAYFGYAYPDELHQKVCAYVDRIRGMRETTGC